MSIRRDERAVSEVVGALMLVIVVTAAVASFAAFTLDQQEKVQELKVQQQRREAEDFRVLAIDPVQDAGDPNQWGEVTFTVQSLSPHAVHLSGVRLNGDGAVEYTLVRQEDHDGDGVLDAVTYRVKADPDKDLNSDGDPDNNEDDPEVELLPRERFTLVLDRSADFATTPAWPKATFLKLDLMTAHGNTFPFTYIPPSAVGFAAQIDGDTFVLDASRSEPAGDAHLVDWKWATTGAPVGSGCSDTAERHGRLASVDLTDCVAGTYSWSWTLTVTDSDGLVADVGVTFGFTV